MTKYTTKVTKDSNSQTNSKFLSRFLKKTSGRISYEDTGELYLAHQISGDKKLYSSSLKKIKGKA